MKDFFWRWVDRPWRLAGVVAALCAASLATRMCLPWDLAGLLFYPWRPKVLGFIVVWTPLFGPGALGLCLAVLALKHRRTLESALPLAVVALSAVLLVAVPWDRAYFRAVWLLHERQYANVVRGLADGRLLEGRGGG